MIMPSARLKTIEVDAEIAEKLEQIASEQNRPARDLFDEALGTYLDRRELIRELDERSREMDETGLHVTHEEAMEWLTKLASGENPPLPKAHT